jgi:hypothetical protein
MKRRKAARALCVEIRAGAQQLGDAARGAGVARAVERGLLVAATLRLHVRALQDLVLQRGHVVAVGRLVQREVCRGGARAHEMGQSRTAPPAPTSAPPAAVVRKSPTETLSCPLQACLILHWAKE